MIELEQLNEIAKEAAADGDRNLAIVLYAYLGAVHARQDQVFAEYCQVFARHGLDAIDRQISKRN